MRFDRTRRHKSCKHTLVLAAGSCCRFVFTLPLFFLTLFILVVVRFVFGHVKRLQPIEHRIHLCSYAICARFCFSVLGVFIQFAYVRFFLQRIRNRIETKRMSHCGLLSATNDQRARCHLNCIRLDPFRIWAMHIAHAIPFDAIICCRLHQAHTLLAPFEPVQARMGAVRFRSIQFVFSTIQTSY